MREPDLRRDVIVLLLTYGLKVDSNPFKPVVLRFSFLSNETGTKISNMAVPASADARIRFAITSVRLIVFGRAYISSFSV